jgi:hypothetical protein
MGQKEVVHFCQWPDCESVSSAHLYYEEENIRVCGQHRGAVLVNIETAGRIWIASHEQAFTPDAGESVRPSDKEPVPKNRPSVEREIGAESEQSIAQKASAAAVTLDSIVEPNKRG